MGLDSRALGIVVCGIVLNVLAALAVCGRLWARRLRKVGLGSDDWVIMAALILSIFLGVFGVWASFKGVYTTSVLQATPAQYVLSRKVQFTEVLVVHLSVGLIKVSALLFFLRIFKALPWFKWICNGFLALTSIWIVGSFFSVIGAFKDVSTYWTAPGPEIRDYENINYAMFIVVTAGIDVALDVIVLSLPILPIRTLQMSAQRKIKLVAVFMLGAFCLVASIVRLYYAHKLVTFSSAQVATDAFITAGLNQTLWSRIEVAMSVTTACLPPMSPLFRDLKSLESLSNSLLSLFSRSSGSVNAGSAKERDYKGSREAVEEVGERHSSMTDSS